ncbi:oligosaccharide flippase family protein [Pseudoalteromonas sp. ASV78]|uniref:oligosaccharide flippase family protein n=1 Tax=Pseudoalteromonas sp. ASV78 TaxID=3397851 RepID=UPI0039FD908B
MPQSNNSKNLAFILSGVLVNAITLFVVYKYVLVTFGAELASIWALVMSISGAAKLADFGLATVMPKFISESIAKNLSEDINKVLGTAFYSVLIFGLVIAALIFLVFTAFAGSLFDAGQLNIANELIVYALPSFVVTAVGNSLLYSLDGWGDAHLRAKVTIISVIIYAVLSLVLSSFLGLPGLILAHLMQALFMFLLASIYLMKKSKVYFFLPHYFSLKHFKLMFKISVNIQLISVLSIFGDNLVKILIGYYADVKLVVFYEMASKLVSQVRMLAINGCQLLVPIISKMNVSEKTNSSSELTYDTFKILMPMSIIIFSGLFSISPLISYLWLGEVSNVFIYTLLLLVIGMIMNIPISPFYFANLADNKVTINLIGQFIISISNLVLSIALGSLFGFYGIVVSYVMAISIGSIYIFIEHLKRKKLNFVLATKKTVLLNVLLISPLVAVLYLRLTYSSDVILFSIPLAIYFIGMVLNLYFGDLYSKLLQKFRRG